MPSLMELVERVNKGELIEPQLLEPYQDSPNSAEKFLARHAAAILDLRRACGHMLRSLEAIDYSDLKVLKQYLSICSFLDLNDQRVQPTVRFGASAIARREFALGMEAIQSAIQFDQQIGGHYSSNRENCLYIAAQYDRVAQSAGWGASGNLDWNNPNTRIAYVASGIADEESAARTLLGFAKYHDPRWQMFVYSTESSVRRDRQQYPLDSFAASSGKRGRGTIESLRDRSVETWIAPTDGDALTAASALAEQIVRDQIDVIIFDASQADAIAAVTAGWPIVKAKVNLCRQTPLFAPAIDAVVYLDSTRWEADREFWNAWNIDNRFVLEGYDTDQQLGANPQRSVFGIPETAIVLATAGNELDRTITSDFLDSVINILRSHPQAIYLLVGEGEMAWQKRRFESAGVSKRVGYAGKRKDLNSFLRICDIYLAEFPAGDSAGVLAAMSVEKPVVTANWPDDRQPSEIANLIGSEGVIALDPPDFIEQIGRLIREPGTRQQIGGVLRQRVHQNFSFQQTAGNIEQLCDYLLKTPGTARGVRIDSSRRFPLAEVA
jgi:glycosyltransferase involved in cell wall biosynthesis